MNAPRFGRATVAVTALLALAGMLVPRPADAAVVSIQSPKATATNDTITVDWRDSAAGATSHLVVLHDATGAWRGTVQCGATCRSARFTGLPSGTRFTASITVRSGAAWSAWTTAGPVSTPADPACSGVAGACVAVDATRPGQALSRVGQGFQLGIDAATSAERVRALTPRIWRVAARDAQRFTAARATGARITVMLSGPWYDTTRLAAQAPCATCWGGATSPWTDWARYRSFVTSTVQWHIDHGLVPDYWDIQNEPDAREYYDATAPYSAQLVFEQFRVAHDAIRALLPNARIVGPSTSVLRPEAFGARIDLQSFLEFADTAGLRFEVISWHDIGNGDAAPTLQGGPAGSRSRVATVRALVAEHPRVAVAELHVNEYGAEWNRRQPGATVGYLAALEAEGVTYANRTCWDVSECFASPGTVDGLLIDGATPGPLYIVHAAYQAMQGNRTPTTATDRWTSALATTTARAQTVQVLIGRHETCVASVDPACRSLVTAPPSIDTTTVVRVGASGRWRVVVERIANTTGAGSRTVVSDNVVTASSGFVRVPRIAVVDGDAYVVTLTKA